MLYDMICMQQCEKNCAYQNWEHTSRRGWRGGQEDRRKVRGRRGDMEEREEGEDREDGRRSEVQRREWLGRRGIEESEGVYDLLFG